MPSIAGVDPGARGAIAIIDTDEFTLEIFDMPIIPVGKSGKRTEVDGERVAWIFDVGVSECFIEDVWSLPSDGHVGAFNFGDKYGTVKGVAQALGIKLTRVRPNVWKTKMKAPADKKESIERAKKLFPNHVDLFKRVSLDDGRAEAAMIALYGVFMSGIKLTQPLRMINGTSS